MRRILDAAGHAVATALALCPAAIAMALAGAPVWLSAIGLTLSAAGCATLREVAQHRRSGMGLRDIMREINPVDIGEGAGGGVLLALIMVLA